MMNEMTPKHRWLTAPQVRQRFGGRSDAWLWRLLQSEPDFPRPLVIKKQRYFYEDEVEAYEKNKRA